MFDVGSGPVAPPLEFLLLWLDGLFVVLETVLLELFQVLDYGLVGLIGIDFRVKNISAHLQKLLVQLQVNPLWLILLLQVVHVQSACELLDVVAQH